MSSRAHDHVEKLRALISDALSNSRDLQVVASVILVALSMVAYFWPRRDVRNLPPGPKPGFWGNPVPKHMWLYFDKLAKQYGTSHLSST
jgi:hypothetical protein